VGGNVKIPWKTVEKDQDAFIDPKYLPERVHVTQVHHIVQHDANAILQHWDNRRKAGEVPFRFKKVNQLHCAASRPLSPPTMSQEKVIMAMVQLRWCVLTKARLMLLEVRTM
jgi:hypothetical protein